jgi:glutathione S-transferase
MVLKLYGHPMTPGTKRVAVVAIEAGVPFEFTIIDITKGEHKSQSHFEKQPFGKVPYIVRPQRSDFLSTDETDRESA